MTKVHNDFRDAYKALKKEETQKVSLSKQLIFDREKVKKVPKIITSIKERDKTIKKDLLFLEKATAKLRKENNIVFEEYDSKLSTTDRIILRLKDIIR